MKHHTALQYAKALNALVTESPDSSSKIIKEFLHTLSKNDDLKLASEIVHHFEKIIHQEEKVLKAEVTLPAKTEAALPKHYADHKLKTVTSHDISSKGGIEIRIKDVLIENTISRRMKQLKAVIG